MEPLVEHIVEAGGIYFRSIRLPQTGMKVPQHVHDHDHATLVCQGRAQGYCDGVWMGVKGPGEVFEVKAGHQHEFQAVLPDTILTCVHDIESTLSIKRKGL